MAGPDIDIAIIGGGVLGLATAAELAARGRAVLVIDTGGPNASLVAAGMIAPAFESAAEDADQPRADLLRHARDLWPDFAERHGLTLKHAPSEWRGDDEGEIAARLDALGFAFRREGGAVITGEDVQIDAGPALERLAKRVERRVGQAASVARDGDLWRVDAGGEALTARTVILATGAAGAINGLPDAPRRAVEAIQPIRGQIGLARGAGLDRVVRGRCGYAVPSADGVLVGASMEVGRRDLAPDAAVGETLRAFVEALLGQPLGDIDWRVGVRGATADGLPLAGAVGNGLHLALAPRRNGWLLAPLVARVVADAVEGRERGAHAAALDPLRLIPR